MLKVAAIAALAAVLASGAAIAQEVKTGTLTANGVEMYYEIHGQGSPLVLLHGAYMNIPTNWDAMIPTLAADHQVIAVELQGHGRTADIDRPITYEDMADDVAALLGELDISKASLFGYSMGGGVALQFAIRHPEMTDRLVVASASFSSAGLPEGFVEMIGTITPEMFKGSPMEAEYLRLAPNPDGFPVLVDKLKELDLKEFDWTEARSITAPTLLVFGDADIITHQHASEMYKALGGTENADINGFDTVQMLMLPGSSHVGVMANPLNLEILKAAVPAFLEAEMPPKPPMM